MVGLGLRTSLFKQLDISQCGIGVDGILSDIRLYRPKDGAQLRLSKIYEIQEAQTSRIAQFTVGRFLSCFDIWKLI